MSRYNWPRNTAKREHGDDPAGRTVFMRRRRMEFDPEGALQVSRTPQAAHHAGMPGPLAPADTRQRLWQPLGPAVILGGQADGRPRVSGRVNALCVHDGGQRAYAASANGGVWYTKDGGANWVSVAGLATTNTAGIVRPAQRNACGAIQVEFGTNEGDDLVFLGTGEVTHPMLGQPGLSEGGIGILVGDKPTKSALPDPWVREAPNLVNDGVYRIMREPGGTTVIAATRTGLWQRPAAPGKDVDWVRPTATPFNTLASDCTDLLWTPAHNAIPARLWVWVKEGANMGLWVRAASAANFEKVALAASAGYGYTAGRACLAASTPPTQVWVVNDRGASLVAGLFRVTNPDAGPAKPVAHTVVGVPNILHDSGFYNIAIAVHPAQPDTVVLAGSYLQDFTLDGAQANFNAGIVVADVAADAAHANVLTYGHPTPYTMIGIGVHADVHAVAFSNNGASLWACCDGGVFRSDLPRKPAGFYSRNNGLTISESNYIAGHPTCEGHLIAGLQDNGVVTRLSNGVWRVSNEGDGGGVIMDAINPARSLAQYVRGTWNRSEPGGTGPLVRGASFSKAESDQCAFYSAGASIAHVRTPSSGSSTPISQTLIGTIRVWYSDNFGASWVTLPSGSDPLPANPTQDSFGQPITVCRWQSPDVAWILGEGTLMRYVREAGSHNGGTAGSWSREDIFKRGSKRKKDTSSFDDALRKSPVWTDIAVNLDPPAAPGQPPARHGSKGAVYLGTVGHPDDDQVDTLWWFDGSSKWFKTGLRKHVRGVPAPVTALVCDPNHPEEVWIGTTVGVWRGVRTQAGNADPTWDFEARLNGLPEAAVEDLAIYSNGTIRLLRAAIAARGTWELRLDTDTVDDLTYIRAHDDDLRYQGRAAETQRNLVTARSWHGSPDVRPRPAPAAVAAPAATWSRSLFTGTVAPALTEQLRRFQAALRSSTNDVRVVANGIWDAYFSEVLRDHGAPTVHFPAAPPLPAFDVVTIDQPFWNAHMTGTHATAEPWGTGTPSEADLYELTPKLVEGDANSASCELRAGANKVDIVVHHRGLDVVDGADVRVTLLWWADPAITGAANWNNAATWFGSDVPWTAAVNEVLNSADGKTTQAVGAGWSFALGGPNDSHRATLGGQTLTPTQSGVVTFDLDLSTAKPHAVVLLVAVVRAGSAANLAAAKLKELALTRPTVAVRSIHIVP